MVPVCVFVTVVLCVPVKVPLFVTDGVALSAAVLESVAVRVCESVAVWVPETVNCALVVPLAVLDAEPVLVLEGVLDAVPLSEVLPVPVCVLLVVGSPVPKPVA